MSNRKPKVRRVLVQRPDERWWDEIGVDSERVDWEAVDRVLVETISRRYPDAADEIYISAPWQWESIMAGRGNIPPDQTETIEDQWGDGWRGRMYSDPVAAGTPEVTEDEEDEKEEDEEEEDEGG